MVTPAENDLLRWIAFLPLLAAAFHGVALGLTRRPSPRWMVVAISCGSVLVSFFFSCWAFAELIALPDGQRLLLDDVYTWIGSGIGSQAMSAELAFLMDPLSAVMCLVVTGVGFLIHVYSIGYMDDDHREDRGFQRFFCYLNLFTFSMLVLVLGENIVLMFLGWEGVGLCSYLLIGFWYSDRYNAYCGSKAFIVNRIGDFGMMVGIFVLFWALSTAGAASVSFREINAAVSQIAELTVSMPWGAEYRVVTVVALCFFLAACGKSAQIPLYVWLPDAMAGPTPVSALIHAATMVTAGVYMVCRLSPLYAASPEASAVVAWVGALTALFAATIAITQTDIKKVLAYSTVSQLGYMFLAAGSGAYSVAIFHLGTHAFFKALLFLGAGAVIMAMHHEQDIDKMGGLWKRIRSVAVVFGIGVIAISGFPPFSGFFSKDEILVRAFASSVPGHVWLYRIGLLTAGITAFYMWRLFFRTFFGELRAPAEVRARIHEPPATVMWPLYVLSFFSVFAGFIGLPQVWGDFISVENSDSLGNFLAPVLAPSEPHALEHSTEYAMAATAIGVATAGLALAWYLYVSRPDLPGKISAALRYPYRLILNKYYVDEAYDAVIVRPTVAVSDRVLFRFVDAGIIDGLGVNGMARTVRAVADGALKHLQTGLTQSYVFLMILGTAVIVGYLVR
ncbi:MAG: NADH-quinone oxidoreductase subunit L [Myxococcota bacterium]|nr:NADH-quinone oxidoreductase subunit L [Myxococcota bacterium]